MGDERRVEFGVITGVGLADAMRGLPETRVETPYGPPSGPVRLTSIKGRTVAMLARRGDSDERQPHLVPYRANVWALASLGVRNLVTSAASSGLRDAFPTGTFVIPDQLIDLTDRPASTFFDHDSFQIEAAEPFDPTLRAIAAEVLIRHRVRFHEFGTAVVTAGPRFPTLAESRWHASIGADLSNMTLLPETTLARELGMAVMNLSFITGNDLGTDRSEPVNLDRMRNRIRQAAATFRDALYQFIGQVPAGYSPPSPVPPLLIERLLNTPTTAQHEMRR